MRIANSLLLSFFLAVSFHVLMPVPARVVAQETAPAEQGAEVIELEELEDVTPPDSDVLEGQAIASLLGRMHPAIVHLPIGWLMMLLLIDTATFVLKKAGWERWGFYTLAGTILSFVPAVTTGFLNARNQLSSSADRLSLITTHRNLIIAMVAICVVAFILRVSRRDGLSGATRWIYLGLIYVAAGLIGLAGHIGGKLVFGVNYLPF